MGYLTYKCNFNSENIVKDMENKLIGTESSMVILCVCVRVCVCVCVCVCVTHNKIYEICF